MRKTTLLAAAMVAALAGFGEGAFAQRGDRDQPRGERGQERGPDRDRGRDGDWEDLGCVDVRRRPEREIIKVGRREGRFEAIRLSAERNDVQIDEVTVVYSNGKPDRLRVPDELREGEKTRPLDLEGRERSIQQVELTLKKDFKGRGRGPARVCLAGFDPRGGDRSARRPQARAEWEELGCVGVGLRPDFDRIEVGRREGRFGAVRLRVKGGKIEVERLRVIYGNGQPDDLVVNADLRKNTETGPIDLEGGRDRVIERIELVTKRDGKDVARSALNSVLRGDGPKINGAAVCVDGLDSRGDRGPPRR